MRVSDVRLSVSSGKETDFFCFTSSCYFAWVHEQDPATILSEKAKDSLKYRLNQESYLKVFLEDGEVPINNSATESAIRPFTFGRANWHIVDTGQHCYLQPDGNCQGKQAEDL